MAPESERAKCEKCGETEDHMNHYSDYDNEGGWHNADHKFQPATLTCSEVVERLIREAVHPPRRVNRKQAEAILHSWRERRVQELEECLREMISETRDVRWLELCRNRAAKYQVHLNEVILQAERLLAKESTDA